MDKFKDLPVKEPTIWSGRSCPRCEGHGEWVLQEDAYPSEEGKYKHFRTVCGACGGSGYLRKGQTCVHVWEDNGTIGVCLHEWKCTLCGTTKIVDSGD